MNIDQGVLYLYTLQDKTLIYPIHCLYNAVIVFKGSKRNEIKKGEEEKEKRNTGHLQNT